MLWIKALHIISLVAWFSGLFYLPRLFIYHTMATEEAEYQRFCTMEDKLYRIIMNPAAAITVILGLILMGSAHEYYAHAGWMHAKLAAVVALIGYHYMCKRYLRQFKAKANQKSERFFRIFNEVPSLLLVVIVILVVVKPI